MLVKHPRNGFGHERHFTTFTCQATVRKNETGRSNVIVPFGLHV